MQDFFPSDALDYWPQRRRVQNLHIKALLAREILLATRRNRRVGFVATGNPTEESIGTSAELSEKAQDCARSIPSRAAYTRTQRAFSFSANKGGRTRPVAMWSLNSSRLQITFSMPKCSAIGRIVKSSVPVTRTLRYPSSEVVLMRA